MTRSHSFFYFGPRQILLLVFAGCCLLFSSGCSRNQNDAADKLSAQAAEAVRQFRYADAEQLFNSALPLYAQADNPDKFNETTAALAEFERKRGKFSQALMHYHAARFYFEQKNDVQHIVSLSAALADLYALTDCRDSARLLASAALRVSTASGNTAGMSLSEYELGRIDLAFRDPTAASEHFAKAESNVSSASTAQISFDIALNRASVLADLGKNDEAVTRLQSAAHSASLLNDPLMNLRLHSASGIVYLRMGMNENAIREFADGLKSDSAARMSGMDVQMLCGIGEVFFANFIHDRALEYFSKAYDRALAEENVAAAGYCLMRMGECEQREALHVPSASSVLKAVTYFQQAVAVFRNGSSPQRLALAQFKEASLRAALHEDADAETLFRSSFELMRSASTQSFCFNEPFTVTSESRLLPPGSSCSDWWYRPFASFLLRERRIGDALAVIADGRAAVLRHEFQNYPIAFQDSTKNAAAAFYRAHMRDASIAESELMARQALPKQAIDAQSGDSLRARYELAHRAALDEASSIGSRYPSLLPLVPLKNAATFEKIIAGIPAEGTLVSYLGIDEKLYAVIIPPHRNAIAIDLGSELQIRIRCAQYSAMIQKNNALAALGQKTDDAAVRQASMQIASILLTPVIAHCSHRLIVYASDEIDAVPLHALLLPSGAFAGASFDITYAPFLASPGTDAEIPPLKNVVSFGAPSSGSLESEYELRSIKNFYPDAAVIVTQLATEKNFRDAAGDLFHLSTFYSRDTQTGLPTFALSGGSITAPENYQPISSFLLARPFSFWIIADQRRDSCLTTREHAMFALMSGAMQCVLQRYPCAASTAKEFNELFYTSLAAHGDGKRAYRETMLQMQKMHAGTAAFSTAPYFLMEW